MLGLRFELRLGLFLGFALELLVGEALGDSADVGPDCAWLFRFGLEPHLGLGLEFHLGRQSCFRRKLRVQLSVPFRVLLRRGLRIRLVGPADGVHDPIEGSLDACRRHCPVFRIPVGFVIEHRFPVEVGVVDVQLQFVDVQLQIVDVHRPLLRLGFVGVGQELVPCEIGVVCLQLGVVEEVGAHALVLTLP